MTKAPTPTEMSKGQSDNTNNATKNTIGSNTYVSYLDWTWARVLIFSHTCCALPFHYLSSFVGFWSQVSIRREKGRDLTESYDKSPYTSRNVKRTIYKLLNVCAFPNFISSGSKIVKRLRRRQYDLSDHRED